MPSCKSKFPTGLVLYHSSTFLPIEVAAYTMKSPARTRGARRRKSKDACSNEKISREKVAVSKRKKEVKARWTKQAKKEHKSKAQLKQEEEPQRRKTRNQARNQNSGSRGPAFNFAASRYSREDLASRLSSKTHKHLVGANRIRFIAEAASFTGSVAIIEEANTEQRGRDEGVQVVTATQTDFALIQNASISIPGVRIYVKPLLVLDINGVLCHRIRDTSLPPKAYRKALPKTIATTKVVLRPNLRLFLNKLFENFCVAIWTSAKMKTAKELVQNLIPKQHRSKLLFVWHQADCIAKKSTNPDSGKEETVFHKDLQKVWQCFPLWNPLNTILIDDSPQKSTCGSQMNMVNPLSLNGRVSDQLADDRQNVMSDEENVEQQQQFFDLLIDLWKTHIVVEQWEIGMDLSILRNSGRLSTFLHEQSTDGNMGWSAGHEGKNDNTM